MTNPAPTQPNDPASAPTNHTTQITGAEQPGATEQQVAIQPGAPLVGEALVEDGAVGGIGIPSGKSLTRATKPPGNLAGYEVDLPPGRVGDQVLDKPQGGVTKEVAQLAVEEDLLYPDISQIQDAMQETEDSNQQLDLAYEPGGSAAQKTLEKQKQIDQIDLQVKTIATKVGQFDKAGVVELFQ